MSNPPQDMESLLHLEDLKARAEAERQARQEYLDERKLLIDAEWQASRGFDKAMLTLAGGAIALSVTFVRQPDSTLTVTWLMLLAWLFISVSLLTTLVSFLVTQRAMRRHREIVATQYRVGDIAKTMKNAFSVWTWRLSLWSIAALFTGVVLLVVFVYLNLSQ